MVRLDPNDLRELLRCQSKAAHQRGELRSVELPLSVLAIDGKTTALNTFDDLFSQRRKLSDKHEHGVVRTLTCSLVSSRSRFCIDVNPIPPATNEMGHFKSTVNQLQESYQGLDLFDLISADAGLSSKENGQFVVDKGLHYLFALKDPLSHLHQRAKELLEALEAHQCRATTTDNLGRKYSVIRRLYQSSQLAGQFGWPTLKTVTRLESVKINNSTGEVVSHENRYFLSDLAENDLKATQWLKLIRLHWFIENDCHGTLDTAFEEDTRPWIKADSQGFLVILVLRRIALNLLSLFRNSVRNQVLRGTRLVKVAWKKLLGWCYLALLGALEEEPLTTEERGTPSITLV